MNREPPSSDRLKPRNLTVSDEAIDWTVRLASASATDDDRAAFAAWLDRSPAHTDAAAEAASIMVDIGTTRQADEYRSIGAAIRPSPISRGFDRRAIILGGATAAVAVGVIASGAFGPPSGLYADYATAIGNRKCISLEDGSVVWLNTATALSVAFSDSERRLRLHAGEALFEVAKDKARPFIVNSCGGETRAIGTTYSVRQRGAISDVVVAEGIVEVRNGGDAIRLAAGQQVAYGDGIQSPVRLADSVAMTAWSRGKLIFNQRPLGEVAEELERYQLGKVVVRGERLRRLEVTGVFELDGTKALLWSISAAIKVPVTRLPLLTIIG